MQKMERCILCFDDVCGRHAAKLEFEQNTVLPWGDSTVFYVSEEKSVSINRMFFVYFMVMGCGS